MHPHRTTPMALGLALAALFVAGDASAQAAAAPALSPHIGHVNTSFRDTPEQKGFLETAIAEHMRPFFDRAVRFLEREVQAGRLRDHDPIELMQLVYGAVMTYFSDAGFRGRLLGEDPLAPAARARFGRALTAMLRDALQPR